MARNKWKRTRRKMFRKSDPVGGIERAKNEMNKAVSAIRRIMADLDRIVCSLEASDLPVPAVLAEWHESSRSNRGVFQRYDDSLNQIIEAFKPRFPDMRYTYDRIGELHSEMRWLTQKSRREGNRRVQSGEFFYLIRNTGDHDVTADVVYEARKSGKFVLSNDSLRELLVSENRTVSNARRLLELGIHPPEVSVLFEDWYAVSVSVPEFEEDLVRVGMILSQSHQGPSRCPDYEIRHFTIDPTNHSEFGNVPF